MLPCGEMAKLLAFLPHLRLPVALACVGLLIADAYLGVGLSETVTMIAAGADVVFGHHAHRLQPLERVAGAPVFWNLGNFVWPNRSEEASRTAVATFRVEPDGSTGACLAPFRIDATGVPRPTGDAPSCQ